MHSMYENIKEVYQKEEIKIKNRLHAGEKHKTFYSCIMHSKAASQ